ncbi:MAG: M6 family metalloprotease domain-containing protein [Rikenellaceae bacterium]|jgi:M6 family metalloprotease-like protein|nr:M6 family metalloprotease domain-containing protein [Rikenellaceae bacterium]
MKRKLAIAALLLAGTFGASDCLAVGAYSRPVKVQQADGSELTIRLHGDEYGHWVTTLDGYDVMQGPDKNYYYADQLFDGSMQPSRFRASNSSARNPETARYLSAKPRNMGAFSARRGAAERRAELAVRQSTREPRPATRADVDNRRLLVILVNFTDKSFVTASPNAQFTAMLNQSGYSGNNGHGSAKDYFTDNSGGRFVPTFDVVGPVTLSHNMAYYGANNADGEDARPQQMAFDAITAANAAGVDFTQYATDYSNGRFIDQIFIFYAGRGEADGGDDDTIWPHAYVFPNNTVVDGCTLDRYACASELTKYYDAYNGEVRMTSIGTVCHEFAHTLGLQDMYDTDYTDNGYSLGLDVLSLMSGGNYNYDGILPAGLTAFERWQAGWITEVNLATMAGTVELPPLNSSTDKAYYLPTDKQGERYFFENRNPNYKWDSKLGGSNCKGLIVYHYDRSDNIVVSGKKASRMWADNEVNCYPLHECMSVLSAKSGGKNGYPTPESAVGLNPDIFFFPNYNATSLGPNTDPQLVSWSWNSLGYKLTNIVRNGVNITFTLSQDNAPPNNRPVTDSYIDIDRSYSSGASITLEVKTYKVASSVDWFVDNAQQSVTTITPSRGEHVVRAVCNYQDGTKEILVKYFKVQ